MKSPNRLLVLAAPAAMILLGYLFLIPQHTEPVGPDRPVLVFVLDPVEKALFQAMLEEGDLPSLSNLIETGSFGYLTPRRAWNMCQGWLETMTGKDASRIVQAAVTLDPETYVAGPCSEELTDGFANLRSITEWHHKRVLMIDRMEQLPGINPDEYDVVIGRMINIPGSERAFLEQFDTRLETLLDSMERPVTCIIVMPLAHLSDTRLFRINDWLKANRYLAESQGQIDWPATRAFCISGAESGIRIHRSDVYSKGPVDIGGYVDFRRELLEKLKALEDPDSGSPLFQHVYDGRKFFSGRQLHQCPDLVVQFADESMPIRLDPHLRGEPGGDARRDPDLFTADPQSLNGPMTSASEGWMILNGPPFLRGVELKNILGVDVTPTVLFLLKIPVAADMQGRVVITALEQPWQVATVHKVPSHERTDSRVRQVLR
ncbi:hypothetical protein JXA40_10270 [bacterium]|nr:hypothetical protein [candidate division CSSED10-310 bacterium]